MKTVKELTQEIIDLKRQNRSLRDELDACKPIVIETRAKDQVKGEIERDISIPEEHYKQRLEGVDYKYVNEKLGFTAYRGKTQNKNGGNNVYEIVVDSDNNVVSNDIPKFWSEL